MIASKQQIKRIALFGGAFDPVHCGHVLLAETALSEGQLDRVYLIPAAQSPLKSSAPRVTDADRLQMLMLATAENPQLFVDDYELIQGGVSFSIDTVRHFRSQCARVKLFWILGADQFEQLHRWRDIEKLAGLVTFLVFARPGHVLTHGAIAGLKYQQIEAPLMKESSSQVREHLGCGQSASEFLPSAVDAFISERGLYTSAEN